MKERIDEKEARRIQLEILKETAKICKENNLMCFLGGGTLLGAVRHKGYIPWDDDIDVMMPRKDYEKLLEIFDKNNRKEEYKLLSYKNTKGYYYAFNKVVDVRTKIIEDNYKEIENYGIYIDIFPIDYLPDDDKKIKKIFKKYRIKNNLTNIYQTKDLSKDARNKVRLILKKMIAPIIRNEKVMKKILKQMDEMLIKYNNTSKVACVSGKYAEKEVMPATYMSDYRMLEFEGEEYCVPIGYKDYLIKHYGDYMKLPPKEQQVKSHHNVAYWR